jgi:tartrate/fumarate subfamily iron-sulfur-dependent hydro-lyase beta chain
MLPLSEAEARRLELGQMVTVTGPVFTGRSLFHIRAIRDNVFPPLDYAAVNGFFHVGPVMRRAGDGWDVVSVEPTSSIRFESYGADVVRKFGLRTLIGKTTMGARTAAALREVGGVYLSKIGICGNRLGKQIRRVREVHFLEELGATEATWVLEVERFGPFFVAIDSEGRNYFEQLAVAVDASMPAVYESLGIREGFSYTEVNASARSGLHPCG